LGQWIRIQIGNPDPEPGRWELAPPKKEKIRNFILEEFEGVQGDGFDLKNCLMIIFYN
jgi:hypothetical protein